MFSVAGETAFPNLPDVTPADRRRVAYLATGESMDISFYTSEFDQVRLFTFSRVDVSVAVGYRVDLGPIGMHICTYM